MTKTYKPDLSPAEQDLLGHVAVCWIRHEERAAFDDLRIHWGAVDSPSPDLPGVMVYGPTQAEAVAKVKALALRVMAERLEHGEAIPELTVTCSSPSSTTEDGFGSAT